MVPVSDLGQWQEAAILRVWVEHTGPPRTRLRSNFRAITQELRRSSGQVVVELKVVIDGELEKGSRIFYCTSVQNGIVALASYNTEHYPLGSLRSRLGVTQVGLVDV